MDGDNKAAASRAPVVPVVDVHMHVYESPEHGRSATGGYGVVEYGPKPSIPPIRYAGDVQDALTSMGEADVTCAVVAGLFIVHDAPDGLVEMRPGDAAGRPVRHSLESAQERLASYNRWICGLAEIDTRLAPFVSVNPWVMAPEESRAHVHAMVGAGARGVKIHPISQQFRADDMRMWPTYEVCQQLGLPILAHSGNANGSRLAEPLAFEPVLEAFPRLSLILAHLGGGAWPEAATIARRFTNVLFDCSEIICWTRAPRAPKPTELVSLVKEIGMSRVMMGTDFP